MKNNTPNQADKLMKKFDLDLRNLLLADLKSSKIKRQFAEKQLQVSTATAA